LIEIKNRPFEAVGSMEPLEKQRHALQGDSFRGKKRAWSTSALGQKPTGQVSMRALPPESGHWAESRFGMGVAPAHAVIKFRATTVARRCQQ
jgi:hypothetical protein